MYAFADDGTLLAFGESINKINNRLNIALKIVKQWADEVGLKISKEKTVGMVFSYQKIKEKINVNLEYDNSPIEDPRNLDKVNNAKIRLGRNIRRKDRKGLQTEVKSTETCGGGTRGERGVSFSSLKRFFGFFSPPSFS